MGEEGPAAAVFSRHRHPGEERFEGHPAHVIGGLPDRGQFRHTHFRLDGVVKTCHGDVVGNPQPGVGDFTDAAGGDRIMPQNTASGRGPPSAVSS